MPQNLHRGDQVIGTNAPAKCGTQTGTAAPQSLCDGPRLYQSLSYCPLGRDSMLYVVAFVLMQVNTRRLCV